ncbi:HAMP domain-containing methyl-accepting chemotaxis protein [Sphingomonas sp. CCH5-D11]|uniref:HAMP domain-containing methyl-accepting chemotaxis protein n=1 Tax=Sphingomonas sp. CCH5-D11 TaxID=1768786 RepID=UPI00082B0CBD|nr:methyl-accepting chemotaxis protein [Sphingomonas sp. CCH5-D11]
MTKVLNDWPLSKKMLLAFAFIGALLIAVATTGIVANRQLSGIATRHVSRGVAGTEALGRLMSAVREHRIIVFSQLNATSPAEARSLDERYEKNKAALAERLDEYAPLAGEFAPQLAGIRADIDKLNSVNDRIFALKKTQGEAAALPLVLGEGKKRSRTAIDETDALIELHQKRAMKADADGDRYAENALYFALALSALAVAALFGIWRMLGKTVASPLAELSSVTTTLATGGQADVPHRSRGDELGEVARAVETFRAAAVSRAEADAQVAAQQQVVTATLRDSLAALTVGDLTKPIATDFPPAYAELKTNFNEALASLRDLIGSVMESASSIRAGSGEIAQASEDLARRTEGNAASLEETSAAIAQMDERLRASAAAAATTVERADGAITTVSGGRSVADQAVQAMGRVSESAKGIDSVIEGLDKIAFQTRVLAMNAAVEAGRAGDAGRGFAVVADLVSALAMRAEEEAKRARDQLTVTQSDIVCAVEMVQKVDGALADISDDVGQVHELLATMAADNQAQSCAITQISAAVGTMDQSTQQNAAMVEETSAAARNLTSEVKALSEQAGRFKVDDRARRAIHAQVEALKPRPQTSAYASPVKPLAPAAVSALTRPSDDDWNEF